MTSLGRLQSPPSTAQGPRQDDDGGVAGVEVKLAAAVSDSDGKHLRWLRDQLGSRFVDGLIITTGPTAYRRKDGIAVVPLALLGS